MKLLESGKKNVDQVKNGLNVPELEILDVTLMHCNVINKRFQQVPKVLSKFIPDKKFGQVITIAPQSLTMFKTTNAEFSFISVWVIDQNNRHLEIEDNVNITLINGTG